MSTATISPSNATAPETVTGTAVEDAAAAAPESKDPKKLAEDIRAAHAEVKSHLQHALEPAKRAGELLIEAKAIVGHGGFEKWVKRHCKFSYPTASNYMRVFREWATIEGAGEKVTSLRAVLRLVTKKPRTGKPRGKKITIKKLDTAAADAGIRATHAALTKFANNLGYEVVAEDQDQGGK